VIKEELGDKKGASICLNNLGNIAKHRGQLDQAEDYYKRSLTIKEELEDKSGVAFALHNLASLALYKGNFDQAYSNYQRSLAIREERGIQAGCDECRVGIIATHIEANQLDLANALLDEVDLTQTDSAHALNGALYQHMVKLKQEQVSGLSTPCQATLEHIHTQQNAESGCLGEWLWIMISLVDDQVDQAESTANLDAHFDTLKTLAQRMGTPVESAMLAHADYLIAQERGADDLSAKRDQAREAFARLPQGRLYGWTIPS
jgi:tetratricopeptide (TPR) repeat protein